MTTRKSAVFRPEFIDAASDNCRESTRGVQTGDPGFSLPRMKCPACGHELTARSAGAITIDVCDGGCGGVWFDNFEMRKVDEAGAHAIRSVPRDFALKVDMQSQRRCPKCPEQLMMRRFFSRLRRTQIDECPECAGIWLDAGEFDVIRRELEESPDTAALNPALNHTVAMLRQRSGM